MFYDVTVWKLMQINKIDLVHLKHTKLDLPFICLFIGAGPFPQMPLCPMQGCPKFFFGVPHYIL